MTTDIEARLREIDGDFITDADYDFMLSTIRTQAKRIEELESLASVKVTGDILYENRDLEASNKRMREALREVKRVHYCNLVEQGCGCYVCKIIVTALEETKHE